MKLEELQYSPKLKYVLFEMALKQTSSTSSRAISNSSLDTSEKMGLSRYFTNVNSRLGRPFKSRYELRMESPRRSSAGLNRSFLAVRSNGTRRISPTRYSFPSGHHGMKCTAFTATIVPLISMG